VSVQDSKQMAHSNSSSRNFLRDAWTEDNVNSMRRFVDAGINNWYDCVVVRLFGGVRFLLRLVLVELFLLET
jgi:hypothetical protein